MRLYEVQPDLIQQPFGCGNAFHFQCAHILFLYAVIQLSPDTCHINKRWFGLEISGPEISAKLSGLLDGRLKKIVITKTGYSPRIIEAKLYGTSGVTTATGEQLQIALGGYSTWMTFQKVVTK